MVRDKWLSSWSFAFFLRSLAAAFPRMKEESFHRVVAGLQFKLYVARSATQSLSLHCWDGSMGSVQPPFSGSRLHCLRRTPWKTRLRRSRFLFFFPGLHAPDPHRYPLIRRSKIRTSANRILDPPQHWESLAHDSNLLPSQRFWQTDSEEIGRQVNLCERKKKLARAGPTCHDSAHIWLLI